MKKEVIKKKSSETYNVSGFYYKKGKIKCRKHLDIKKKEILLKKPDLMVIMMNPGGSKPINGDFNSNKLVDAYPDATQYRIMDFMQKTGFKYARVLNLSDICEISSKKFYNSISTEGKKNTHSIFHLSRRKELKGIFKEQVPTLIAWGVNDKLTPLINDAIAYIDQYSLFYFGVEKPNNLNKYYHPLKRKSSKKDVAWIDQCVNRFVLHK